MSGNWYDQSDYDLRCEWGLGGVETLAPISDVIIIVDVLSFTTSVSIATRCGAMVYPYAGAPDELAAFARTVDAEVAGRRGSGSLYSLSPQSLIYIPSGTRLVLPSPNGSTLSLRTGETPTFAGCLRNARAVASAAHRTGRSIAVIPSGERWRVVEGMRPCFEDLVGAGAILAHLKGSRSPEAQSAIAAYASAESDLLNVMRTCSSGRELIAGGTGPDVDFASELNVVDTAPRLVDGAYHDWNQ